ncbi:hypothetical protein GCM10025795_45800 [Verticiella sediminum]
MGAATAWAAASKVNAMPAARRRKLIDMCGYLPGSSRTRVVRPAADVQGPCRIDIAVRDLLRHHPLPVRQRNRLPHDKGNAVGRHRREEGLSPFMAGAAARPGYNRPNAINR